MHRTWYNPVNSEIQHFNIFHRPCWYLTYILFIKIILNLICGKKSITFRRSTLSNATPRDQEAASSSGVSNVYSTRYSRRSLNQPQRVASVTRYNRLGRRHTTSNFIFQFHFVKSICYASYPREFSVFTQLAAALKSCLLGSTSAAVRESSDQTPGPRRSARISSRFIERSRLSTTLPVPPPILSNTISNPSGK